MAKHIQQLPKTKQPRERLLISGPQNLTKAELLAVILGSGTRKKNVLSLSRQVIDKINQFPQMKLENLASIHGIGQVQAAKIMATLELGRRFHNLEPKPRLLKPENVLHQVGEIRPSHREQLIGLYLNARYELLAKKILAVGSINTQGVEPRDVFAPAIKLPCRSIILAHNHPSGDPQPSQDDISTTKRLKKAADLLGIALLDHLIVTRNAYFSFQQQKLL